jgi:hypothetical protein
LPGLEFLELPVAIFVPEHHRPVVAGGGECLPVRAERDTVDRPLLPVERLADPAPGLRVPEHHRPVVAGGGERLRVPTERDTVDRSLLPIEGLAQFEGLAQSLVAANVP